jgi:hypothetical protein
MYPAKARCFLHGWKEKDPHSNFTLVLSRKKHGEASESLQVTKTFNYVLP